MSRLLARLDTAVKPGEYEVFLGWHIGTGSPSSRVGDAAPA